VEQSVEEWVALADRDGRVVGAAPRSQMRRLNLPHVVVAVLVRDSEGRVYVHRRSEGKDVFPGMHDCFAAGCVRPGEEPYDAACREVAEELGVTGVALQPVGSGWYEDPATRHVWHAYAVDWEGPVVHQPEEVAWGSWMTVDELTAALADPGWPFVPDGRAIVEQLRATGRLTGPAG